MYRIKKINVLSLAYTLTLIYFVVGLFMSLLILFFKANQKFAYLIDPKLIGTEYYQIILIYPFGYAIGGFLSGVIVSFLYNLSSKFTKGIIVDLTIHSDSKRKN